MIRPAARIITLGYARLPNVIPLARIREQDDAIVADIRLKPYSWNTLWTRESLQQTFKNTYVHVPDAGNLNYRGGPIRIANPLGAIAKLSRLVQARPVILLCACTDVDRCHRRVIADMLADHEGWGPDAILHYRPDPIVRTPIQPTLF